MRASQWLLEVQYQWRSGVLEWEVQAAGRPAGRGSWLIWGENHLPKGWHGSSIHQCLQLEQHLRKKTAGCKRKMTFNLKGKDKKVKFSTKLKLMTFKIPFCCWDSALHSYYQKKKAIHFTLAFTTKYLCKNCFGGDFCFVFYRFTFSILPVEVQKGQNVLHYPTEPLPAATSC